MAELDAPTQPNAATRGSLPRFNYLWDADITNPTTSSTSDAPPPASAETETPAAQQGPSLPTVDACRPAAALAPPSQVSCSSLDDDATCRLAGADDLSSPSALATAVPSLSRVVIHRRRLSSTLLAAVSSVARGNGRRPMTLLPSLRLRPSPSFPLAPSLQARAAPLKRALSACTRHTPRPSFSGHLGTMTTLTINSYPCLIRHVIR